MDQLSENHGFALAQRLLTRPPSMRWLLFLPLCLVACSVPGATPGSPCERSHDGPACAYGFQCSQVELCTRRCAIDAGCESPCRHDWDCAEFDSCEQGVCASTARLGCDRGYCVPRCYRGAGCEPDAYGPTTRSREEDER